MNKKITILSAVIIILVTLGWNNNTQADGYGSAIGDCNSVTFTTAPGTRMLFGTDANPPGELNDAHGLTQAVILFPYFNAHDWTFVVFANDGSGTILDRGIGHVDGCVALPYPDPQTAVAHVKHVTPRTHPKHVTPRVSEKHVTPRLLIVGVW